jgi:antibiotic biosynthesis monooxygenase (ABM) superfamily enzyme
MKTPDSGPRFRSATRHYHRYREENREGWKNWVDGQSKPARFRRIGQWKWLIAIVGVLGVALLLVTVFFKVI